MKLGVCCESYGCPPNPPPLRRLNLGQLVLADPVISKKQVKRPSRNLSLCGDTPTSLAWFCSAIFSVAKGKWVLLSKFPIAKSDFYRLLTGQPKRRDLLFYYEKDEKLSSFGIFPIDWFWPGLNSILREHNARDSDYTLVISTYNGEI